MEARDWDAFTDEQDMQIRTRGAVQSRGGRPTIRTRSSVRTRAAATVQVEEKMPLGGLIADLRQRAHGSPLAVLIHGWDTPPAQTCLNAMVSWLDSHDALWLVPAAQIESVEAPTALPEAVVLHRTRAQDQRIYDNLVVDILFFPEGEPAVLDAWRQRAEAVIVSAAAPGANQLIARAVQNGQVVYRWADVDPGTLVRL